MTSAFISSQNPQIIFKTGDIVDESVEGLVCSGNIHLNMSGGVNGELYSRGGQSMQRHLHDWLTQNRKRFVDPGFAIRIGPHPFAFKSIVYTVAVDVWYDSSIDLTCRALENALTLLAEDGCVSIAIPALATGYGHLTKHDFGRALKQCLVSRFWPFAKVVIVLLSDMDLEEVQGGFEQCGDA